MTRAHLSDPAAITALADQRMLVRFHDGGPIFDRTSDAIVTDAVMQQLLTAGHVVEEPRTGPATFYVTPDWT